MNEKELKRCLKKGENEHIEFKRVGTFNNSEEIAIQLVAFANRDGGKILFGVNNDGTIQGERINFDKKANLISNVAKGRCSPQVQIKSHRFKLEKADVLAIEVDRRKDIPHAIITKKENKEIKSRTYYIRTISGTRLIDDKELEWMFLSSEPLDIMHEFNILTSIGFNPLGIFDLKNRYVTKSVLYGLPPGQQFYEDYFNMINSEKHKELFQNKDEEKKHVGEFIFELLPIIILHSLSKYFEKSCLIEISGHNPIIVSAKEKTDFCEAKEFIDYSYLKKTSIHTIIGSERIKKSEISNRNLYLPKETKIKIMLRNKKELEEVVILFNNPSFQCKLILKPRGWEYNTTRDSLANIRVNLPRAIGNSKIYAKYEAKFLFPEERNELLNQHYDFCLNLLEIIKLNWDCEYKQERFIYEKLTYMDFKLDILLDALEDKVFASAFRLWDIENQKKRLTEKSNKK